MAQVNGRLIAAALLGAGLLLGALALVLADDEPQGIIALLQPQSGHVNGAAPTAHHAE